MVVLGRGSTSFDPEEAGMGEPRGAADYALAEDLRAVGPQLAGCLTGAPEDAGPEEPLGLVHGLAHAFAARVDEASRAETLLALDDACLAGGPRTRLQEAMLDVVAEALGVELRLEAPS